ncbi:hypothetical protein BS17DRAFT_793538 [Gyrodon lividus]|nr:hypothetical protein BS17DRAFT_793538 [Gyrodon lividus]
MLGYMQQTYIKACREKANQAAIKELLGLVTVSSGIFHVFAFGVIIREMRFAKFSLLGIFALGITGWTAFEGTHMWVETVELVTELDDEIRRWEWDRDVEKWSGGELGGTDPALGFKGRHAVRSSWMAENWGVGSGASVFGSSAFSGRGPQGSGGLNYLDLAVKIAESRVASGKLRPQTINELLARQGAILERMGTKDAFFEARSKYERVWAGLVDKGSDAARIASKLGDLNFRLGDSKDALAWWMRAISLTQGSQQVEGSATPTISQSAPSSPSAQRTLASTLVSLSAYYSTSGQLKLARQIQESVLVLLRNIPSPPSISAASPPHALHSLYLLHRSSLISIHLAEVLYALRSPRQSSIDHLTRAAESSERVALALSGLPPFSPADPPGSNIANTPIQETTILPVYAGSNAMLKPARGLLRDARRTAAEAWSLMGILNEDEKNGGKERALECYERALVWAGAASDGGSGDEGTPGEGILEAEWKLLWANYVRAREEVRAQEKS